jgi:pimeloyl-ACP methyl ester carboxylesterase
VQADYYAGADAPLYSLRPASYITDNGGSGLLSHAWVLPAPAVQQLKGQTASLRLHYSLTLLKPRSYGLPTDGKRHRLPGLGFCSAQMSAAQNHIEVDCFSAFVHPAQISAELNGISASRVYSAADFSPAWTQWPFSQRVKIAIGSPRLARHESITLTTWEVAGYLNESLTLPGILGAGLETCPLPTAENSSFQKSRWRDAAPHETYSISVDEGVQLEVLDFGGEGLPIVLLPGLGATAHSYDDLAPLLARKHRVIAVTRRGAGYSSKPDFGFDTPRLSQDVLEVMDEMRLQKVVLVGSSIAGEELTWLGGHHPERFEGLVYLDAAYDRSQEPEKLRTDRFRELTRSLPPEPPIPPASLRDYEAMSRFLKERGHAQYPEGELIALLQVNNPYLAGLPNIDARTQQAITAAIQAPDYAALKIPALAIYAFANPDHPLPSWYDANDKALLATLAEIARISDAKKRRDIELFKHNVEKGQVLEMPNATHYIIQSNQEEVRAAIDKFVDGLGL